MRVRNGSIVAVVSSLLLTGCATSALDMAPPRPDQPWSPATTSSGEIIAGERNQAGAANSYVLPVNSALTNIPPPPAVDPTEVYSLSRLIDVAESNNSATRIAWNDARRVALAAGIAESTYLPRITATAIGGFQGNSGSDSVQGVNFNNSGSANGTVSAVSLQWLLFDFGKRAAVVEAAKQASVISNIAFNATHQQVIYNVTLAFYTHAAAKARAATAAQSLSDAQAVQNAAEERYKHGIGTVIEVAQARQGTAQANLALVQATGGEQDAYLALLTAMGVSPLTHIKVADVAGRNLSPSMATSVEAIVSESLGRRPDVLGAYAARSASLANIRAAQAEFMPKIFLSAIGSYNEGGLNLTALPSASQEPPTVNVNGHRFNGGIFVGLTIPIYDGGTRSAVLAQARADADSADTRLTHVRDEAVRQIVQADNALRTSLSAYQASKALAGAAQTTFDAALAAYHSGVGSITDLTLANSQLLQARNASTDAYSTALSAAAMLALATGTLGATPE
ncbi:outer membrane efflux family protein [Paraburkholderia xenovorans LB400]|uniref:Protein CyaE n=1 Tax=Paraburkholderia xenovorans (strain LB400) TaxID=266265 RepID=Q13PX4_PARXL|nr:TolC family protein [Paraburkholderia xenovorans]ABE33865.1 Outer membrane efflux protein [Paraburkholderia xenovorans LB400]AIP36399.1 outer membrane efflux family protein [Paraburkholderia xenovorans LB400]